jgi:hypothetical protein
MQEFQRIVQGVAWGDFLGAGGLDCFGMHKDYG